MKKSLATRGMFCFVVGIISLLLPDLADAKAIQFTYSNIYPATHFNAKLADEWCKEVEKRTNGRVKIVQYFGQSLTRGAECYDGVVSELSDLGMSVLQYTRGRFPLIDFINLPLGYPSGKVATAIINEVYEKFRPEELTDTRVMYLHAHGPGFIHTKDKLIEKMEDLRGLKIRSHGPTAEMIKALGGTPVAFPMPELYQALQKGVVHGGIYPMEANKGWKLAEVTNYAIACYPSAYSLGFFVVMNKGKWNKLPSDIKETIEKINMEWILKHGEAWDKADYEGIRFFMSKRGRMIGIDDAESARWVKAVQPVIDEYRKNLKSKGLPGDEVINYVRKRLQQAQAGKFASKYATSQ